MLTQAQMSKRRVGGLRLISGEESQQFGQGVMKIS